MLDVLMRDPNVSHVYCLNRAKDGEKRQEHSSENRGLPADWQMRSVHFLHADLAEPHLGLDDRHYKELLEHTSYVIHVNAQGGYHGNALQAASSRGHETIVQMLLNKNADVNTQGGYYGNALQAASFEGHETVVQILLNKKADVNAQGGEYGNALQAASSEGHETVVQILLDKNADVNAQGGYYGKALQAASSRGHETVVQMLLDKNADVNALALVLQDQGEKGSGRRAESMSTGGERDGAGKGASRHRGSGQAIHIRYVIA